MRDPHRSMSVDSGSRAIRVDVPSEQYHYPPLQDQPKPGFFSRMKSFFGGSDVPNPAAAHVHPPAIISPNVFEPEVQVQVHEPHPYDRYVERARKSVEIQRRYSFDGGASSAVPGRRGSLGSPASPHSPQQMGASQAVSASPQPGEGGRRSFEYWRKVQGPLQQVGPGPSDVSQMQQPSIQLPPAPKQQGMMKDFWDYTVSAAKFERDGAGNLIVKK